MQRELNAILTVLAVGYDVTVEINGMNIGVKGQKNESIKLFGKNNPTVTVLPDDMKNQICLIEGNNTISVTCKRIDEKSSPELTIELQARDLFVNGATNFCKKEKISVGDEKSFTDIFSV